MMNESIFFLHSIIVISFLYLMLYLGKEALTCFFAISWVFANLFVTKEILFFGYEVTATDVYTIGGMLALSCLTEYWGRKAASKALKLSLILLLFTTIAAVFQLAYIPSPSDSRHPYFEKLFSSTPRLMIASAISFITTQSIEITLLSYMKRFTKLPFWLRAYSTGTCTQLIDTLLFSFLGLYGLVHSIWDIVVVSFCIKLVVLTTTTPFLAFSKRIFAKRLSQSQTAEATL
jgi:queuosine precursor transporter